MLEHSKTVGDAISIGACLGTLAGYLPLIAAMASLIWTVIRIYEMKTIQDLLNKRKQRKQTRRKPKC